MNSPRNTHQIGRQVGSRTSGTDRALTGDGAAGVDKTPLVLQRSSPAAPASGTPQSLDAVVARSIADRLGDRDWQILTTVRAFKYLSTRQLARQHFGMVGRACVIPRRVNSALIKLERLGLLVGLQRRIGGVKSGSGGKVWQITDLAERSLATHYGQARGGRVRAIEPGTGFLDHTLAVAEVVLTLQEATHSSAAAKATLVRFELEPEAWRTYRDSHGVRLYLKTDLTATTRSGGYEDLWFIEVDRATEPPIRVVRKCLEYQTYRATDTEQKTHGLFPAVVWVVPHIQRQAQLRARLAAEKQIDDRLFTIVTTSELADLIRLGAEVYREKHV